MASSPRVLYTSALEKVEEFRGSGKWYPLSVLHKTYAYKGLGSKLDVRDALESSPQLLNFCVTI